MKGFRFPPLLPTGLACNPVAQVRAPAAPAHGAGSQSGGTRFEPQLCPGRRRGSLGDRLAIRWARFEPQLRLASVWGSVDALAQHRQEPEAGTR